MGDNNNNIAHLFKRSRRAGGKPPRHVEYTDHDLGTPVSRTPVNRTPVGRVNRTPVGRVNRTPGTAVRVRPTAKVDSIRAAYNPGENAHVNHDMRDALLQFEQAYVRRMEVAHREIEQKLLALDAEKEEAMSMIENDYKQRKLVLLQQITHVRTRIMDDIDKSEALNNMTRPFSGGPEFVADSGVSSYYQDDVDVYHDVSVHSGAGAVPIRTPMTVKPDDSI